MRFPVAPVLTGLVAVCVLILSVGPAAAVHLGSPHPIPVVTTFHGCGPRGRGGGDPDLNYLKNRIDEATAYENWTIHQLLDLPMPDAVTKKGRRADWPPDAAATIAHYEGAPVRTVGFLVRQKKQSAESTNCGSTTYVDSHFWVTVARGQLQAQSVVAEPSPRTIAKHPKWQSFLRSDKRYAEGEEPQVRLSGWLMFDQEHPEQLGEHRGTLWEVHPVTTIEVWNGNQWVDLSKAAP